MEVEKEIRKLGTKIKRLAEQIEGQNKTINRLNLKLNKEHMARLHSQYETF